jgi:dihydroorotate dehydrogenase
MMTDIMVDTPLDGIVATNGTARHTGLVTDLQTLKRYGSGAVSGKPLTARSIEVVRRIYDRSNGTYPIIGVGGIMTAEDAKAMLDAGATLVQIYTGFVYNGPNFVGDICRHLELNNTQPKQ